ncbi:MAG: vitamin B12-dependent ribonucleotide reductase, partial [Bdellovibrionota bacterium]
VIKSGGKTRRAAKMQILNVEHPDIEEFIQCKTKEEKKAWALIDSGYDGSFSAVGGAYDSVSFQNANLSVRANDLFMQAAKKGKKYWTREVKSGDRCEQLDARDVLNKISEGTYICGDPGMQFDDVINRWHTCPNSGRINSSNPCSEYMHLDNSACNLASINLLEYLDEDGVFDVEGFKHTVNILITAQDILIDNSSYPTEEIASCARDFRQLGLGFANLGALLMNLGLPYNSDEGRDYAAAITSLMSAQSYLSSANLADNVGSFAGYDLNREPMLEVIKMHAECADALKPISGFGKDLARQAALLWAEALEAGKNYGYRNSQTTVLAPTGTISFMMDCDTTGIEPDLGLVKYKKLSDGGYLKIVNHSVKNALVKLHYSDEHIEEIVHYIDKTETIEGAPHFKDEHLPVFDCAFKPKNGIRSIDHHGHLKMMGAIQPFLSGAISKTVNLPADVTVEQITEIYFKAWEMGIKAVALYRDGSKRTQPLSAGEEKKAEIILGEPVRRRLPDERQAVTHKFSVGGLKGYLTVGLYEDKTPGEIFLVVAKEGSTLSGMMDAFATSVSIALQYGVPLSALVRKFSHMRFEPSGFTGNKEIPSAKSVIDYIFQWLGKRFLSIEEQISLGMVVPNYETSEEMAGAKSASLPANGSGASSHGVVYFSDDAPPCTSCGSGMMVRQGACYVCLNCGAQGGCG